MLRVAIVASLSLLAVPAFADGAKKEPKLACKPLEAFKSEISDGIPGIKFTTPLSSGQFHVVQGLWLGLPNTPPGLPPADSAILGLSSEKTGLLILIRGKQACAHMLLPPPLLAILQAVHTGKLEEAPVVPAAGKPDPDEMKL